MTQDRCLKSDHRSDSPTPGRPGERKLNGRMYFSRQAERTVFFYLTIAMLLAGIVYRMI